MTMTYNAEYAVLKMRRRCLRSGGFVLGLVFVACEMPPVTDTKTAPPSVLFKPSETLLSVPEPSASAGCAFVGARTSEEEFKANEAANNFKLPPACERM